MLNDCLFCAIAAGEIPGTIVHQDELAVAFRDIDPVAPTHVLVIPRRHVRDLGELADHADDAQAVLAAVREVARIEGLADYRTVLNTGAGAGQSVFHVHAHVIGGRGLSWPPG
ncbi:MAG: histidine triad nucleotide-binding protein [Pseudonocardiales bacterium]|jgi:histidine triad (HIT) family protein|nr:histidine triad nucleotide-binding protein [Pseudonocardiales bacterium]